MVQTRFVADTSVFARLTKPAVAAVFAPLAAQGHVALCAPVAFELGYAARNPDDYRELADGLASFPWVPVTDADNRRALELQALLAARTEHRALSLVDGLVAAIAEGRDLVALHYDADFERLAELTGLAHQWVVPRGEVD